MRCSVATATGAAAADDGAAATPMTSSVAVLVRVLLGSPGSTWLRSLDHEQPGHRRQLRAPAREHTVRVFRT